MQSDTVLPRCLVGMNIIQSNPLFLYFILGFSMNIYTFCSLHCNSIIQFHSLRKHQFLLFLNHTACGSTITQGARLGKSLKLIQLPVLFKDAIFYQFVTETRSSFLVYRKCLAIFNTVCHCIIKLSEKAVNVLKEYILV